MKCYFARPINLYGTPQDERDIALIKSLGFEMLNPNKEEVDRDYKARGMIVYEELVRQCDALCFRACPDGSITAGVAKEIAAAEGKPIFELPCGIHRRTLTVEATREYLRNCGER